MGSYCQGLFRLPEMGGWFAAGHFPVVLLLYGLPHTCKLSGVLSGWWSRRIAKCVPSREFIGMPPYKLYRGYYTGLSGLACRNDQCSHLPPKRFPHIYEIFISATGSFVCVLLAHRGMHGPTNKRNHLPWTLLPEAPLARYSPLKF